MRIKLNGTDANVDAGVHLIDVLRTLGIETETQGVAVAMNDHVVPRREWTSHTMKDGDVVEIIRAVQGG